MAKYGIFETTGFTGDLEKLEKAGASQVVAKLKEFVYPQLRINPYLGQNIKKLRNWSPETWRYRVGDWRFFYQVEEDEATVFMIAAYHRKEAYR